MGVAHVRGDFAVDGERGGMEAGFVLKFELGPPAGIEGCAIGAVTEWTGCRLGAAEIVMPKSESGDSLLADIEVEVGCALELTVKVEEAVQRSVSQVAAYNGEDH